MKIKFYTIETKELLPMNPNAMNAVKFDHSGRVNHFHIIFPTKSPISGHS
jgi:hypothetical protein